MNAETITRQSGSNLALAFFSLDRERRGDITLFYAFCRVIDDIADSGALAVDEKRQRLGTWRAALIQPTQGEDALASEIRDLIAKYSLTPAMLEEIIAGVEMDLGTVGYNNFDELRLYCYRVASAVGLVSIEIFGYKNPRCREYAIELGLALQTTNIIRDVATDLRNGRVYLPLEELTRFSYSEEELQRRVYDDHFVALMEFQAERSRRFYDQAAELLPREDRRAMLPARIMASVYRALLGKMERDRFRVFERNYRLNRLEKAARIAVAMLNFA
ncbi:MAG: phytoene/squalene synthase family protein [Chthoniobacterales bacterium]